MPRKGGEKKFIARKKEQKKKLKGENEADMAQDYRLNKVEKKVDALNKATKNFAVAGLTGTLPTIVGKNSDSSIATLSPTFNSVMSDVVAANRHPATPDGEFFSIKHIGAKYQLSMDPASSSADEGTSTLVRVLALAIHQLSGDSNTAGGSTEPNINDIFAMPQAVVGLTSADILSSFSRTARQNFEVLYDKFHVLTPCSNADGETGLISGVGRPYSNVEHMKIIPSKRSQGVTLNLSGNTGLINTSQNAYVLLAFTDGIANNVTMVVNWCVDMLE